MATVPKAATKLGPAEASRTVGKVLARAKTFSSPAIVVVEFSSERSRLEALEALKTYLAETDDVLVEVNLRDQQDLLEAVANLAPNQIASVHGLHAQPELVRRLNWRREFFTDNNMRVVFWLNFEEVKDLVARAPDFWAFRNRHLMLEPSPREAAHSTESRYHSFGVLELSNLPAQAKADRIEALGELLAGIDNIKSPRAQIIRDDLAQLLWETGHYEEAIEHLLQSPAAHNVVQWLTKLRKRYDNFDTSLWALFPYGDTLLYELTGQAYTFYRDAPLDLPEQILALLDKEEEAAA